MGCNIHINQNNFKAAVEQFTNQIKVIYNEFDK